MVCWTWRSVVRGLAQHRVVSQTRNFTPHCLSLPRYKMGTGDILPGATLRWTNIPSRESSNTLSCFTSGWAPALARVRFTSFYPEKIFQGYDGIRAQNFRDTGMLLYQLSYEALMWDLHSVLRHPSERFILPSNFCATSYDGLVGHRLLLYGGFVVVGCSSQWMICWSLNNDILLGWRWKKAYVLTVVF